MHCEFCGFANGDDDHRCLRCGRRTTGQVVAAPATFSGNNALALDPWVTVSRRSRPMDDDLNDTQELPLLKTHAPRAPQAPQEQLFPPGQKVIPFDQIRQPGRLHSVVPPVPPVAPSARPPAAPRKRSTPPSDEQIAMDFMQVSAPPVRTLAHGVPALNYCPRPVATVSHRFFASVVDVTMILIGFSLLFSTAWVMGVAMGVPEVLGAGKPFLILMATFLLVVTILYGTIFQFARRETAGMRIAGLELITFDNAPLDSTTRMVRVAATWLSIGSCGLGVIWAMADEEKLTWQDHISKSFPTFRETDATYVKQRLQ